MATIVPRPFVANELPVITYALTSRARPTRTLGLVGLFYLWPRTRFLPVSPLLVLRAYALRWISVASNLVSSFGFDPICSETRTGFT